MNDDLYLRTLISVDTGQIYDTNDCTMFHDAGQYFFLFLIANVVTAHLPFS